MTFPLHFFRWLVLVAALLLLYLFVFTMPATGQQYPAAEALIGFTVDNNEYGTDRHNSPGVLLNFSYNPHRNLRLVGDFGFQHHSSNIVWANKNAGLDEYQILFGPELAIRQVKKATPFFHAMIGVAGRHYAVPTGNWVCTFNTCYQDHFDLAREFGFASAFGGGVDLNYNYFSYRLVQFDYLRTKLSRDNLNLTPDQGSFPTIQGWQNNYRFSTGILFHIGQRNAGK
jgi:hypothetical protein